MEFTFNMPTSIRFGKDVLLSDPSPLKLGERALIVTGKNSGRKSGALYDVKSALNALKVPYDVFEGIENNPKVEQCKALGDEARRAGADFIIGVGGGSPIDAAKAIAVFAKNDIPCERIFRYGYDNGILPIAAVPTTAGTGSEVTPWSVLTVDAVQTKRSFGGPDTFPRVAFLDPRYTYHMPLALTRNTAMDAFTHAFESLISKKASPMTDAVNLYVLRAFGACFRPLETGDVEPLREKLMLLSMLAGTTIANTGTTLMHALGYPLTYFLDIPHGKANAIVMRTYLYELNAFRKDRLMIALDALGMTYDALMDYLARNYPVPFSRNDVDLERWAEGIMHASSARNTQTPLDKEHILTVYERLWDEA